MKNNLRKQYVISLIGLGYVGMPIAVAFAKKMEVIGFDINEKKIQQYKNGFDPTNEVGDKAIRETTVHFTSNIEDLKKANFHIVAVPTPLTESKVPDLQPLRSATKTVGDILKKGDYVVFESTVYPGVTEDICIPILEEASGLKVGNDFKVGYSPERINPGDKTHTLETIIKVVSGNDEEALDVIASMYELVVKAGVHRAPTIKVAEAAKVIENAQRDINIAFMNELSIIFDKLNINTYEVLEAAKTKWNFLNFFPGLVGGHCIGIDPYYLTYKAEQVGYHSQIILAGRKINDDMGKYVVENVVKQMVKAHIDMQNPKVAVLGLTFKENTPDSRNTRVVDIISEFKEYDIDAVVSDPIADKQEVQDEYGIDLVEVEDIKDMDVVIFAVAHKEFIDMDLDSINNMYGDNGKILIDIKGIHRNLEESFIYWSL